MQNNQLQGDGTWPWMNATIEGDDIVVRGAAATWFGGANDPQDSGSTASGVSTKDHPHILGCALPMNVGAGRATKGSPIPLLPWHTIVHVFCHETGKQLDVSLIDLGPAKYTHHAIDLTVAAFEALGFSLRRGVCHVDFRIVGGAKCVRGG